MPSVRFFYEDCPFRLSNRLKIKEWVKQPIAHYGFELLNLNFIFCSDSYLHSINLQYLNHDTYTDIITFDNSETDKIVEGDIFISIDRVKDNASKLKIAFETELNRVIIHGVLHLLGFKDKTKTEQQKMRAEEERWLATFQ